MKPSKTYHMFHGKPHKEVGEIPFTTPKGFIFLGYAVEIVYRSNKRNGGGDGRMAEYVHKCGKGNILCTDEKRKNLYIFGAKQKVKEEGIIE